MMFAILVPLLCICVSSAIDDEPKCSRFEYEKHLLEMLVRLEFELGQANQKQESMKMEIEELKQNDRKRGTELANFKDHSTKTIQNLSEKLGKELEDGIQGMELKLTNSASGATVPLIYFFGTNPEAELINGRPIFRDVHYNEGDSYDVSTGLFTCRVPGLYHFAFGFSSEQDDFAYCWIYKNNKPLVHAYARDKYNSGSIAAYLHLDVGNTVSIKCHRWSMILHDSSMWYTWALIKK